MSVETVLQLERVDKRFGCNEILRGIHLAVPPGERVAIIGPNGAGKSTLFNLISGRFAPDAGEIRLEGQRIDGLAPHRLRQLGLARSFQVSSLFPRLTVWENLRCALLVQRGLGLCFWRRSSRLAVVNTEADTLLHRLGLAARRDEPAAHLSYAEQRALELGLTVAGNPPLLLLDEPTAGMSRSETERFVALIRELSEGRTLLMVEHDMAVVFELADRVAVLVQGELLAFDSPERIRADARVQAAYLGSSASSASDACQNLPCNWHRGS